MLLGDQAPDFGHVVRRKVRDLQRMGAAKGLGFPVREGMGVDMGRRFPRAEVARAVGTAGGVVRVLFYLSRMISGQLGKGEAYGELKNYRKKWRMRISSSAGCVFGAGKTERSWNAWQRQICISKRLIRI